MVACGSKNKHQKDMGCKDIGLCAQSLLTISDTIVNIIGGTQRIFTLKMNRIFTRAPKIRTKADSGTI